MYEKIATSIIMGFWYLTVGIFVVFPPLILVIIIYVEIVA